MRKSEFIASGPPACHNAFAIVRHFVWLVPRRHPGKTFASTMKLFIYLLFAVVLFGGAYLLLVDNTPPRSAAATAWAEQSQVHLSALLADQMQASQSNNWSSFDADLAKAEAHLAKAPADADTSTLSAALSVYRSQQKIRAQIAQ